ncbi:MAG: phytanoyl-CoA dioxygenase family protein [Vicinamibacterales bacterium]
MSHFHTHGWVRIPGAFSANEAAAMRDVVWRALASVGIRRDDSTTWRKERPDHLQHLKSDRVFQAVASSRTLSAIDEVLGGQPWERPSDWGALFVLFPSRRPWHVPADGWHLDADYAGPLVPPKGVKVHAMFGDVVPRSGGMMIIDGSHRLVHRWFLDHPPKAGARGAELRASVHRHPYVRDLCAAGEAVARIERFCDRVEVVDGIPLQVLENTATAGDVILMHPLLLHAPPSTHLGSTPRFLLNKDIYLRSADDLRSADGARGRRAPR